MQRVLWFCLLSRCWWYCRSEDIDNLDLSVELRKVKVQTLPKAQRTRGLSSGYQSNFLRSYHKFSNKSWLQFIFIISTKQQLQNISQISAFRLILNFKILTKRSLRISTKNNLHNLNQGSAATSASKSCLRTSKFWPNLVLEVWTKKWFYDQTSAAESAPNHRQHISKLNISNSSNLNKFWVGIFTQQCHISQVY